MSKLPDPTDIHVGKRVRMRRLMLKMSQADLASSAGITFQQVQKYEKGTNRISSSRLLPAFLRVLLAFALTLCVDLRIARLAMFSP